MTEPQESIEEPCAASDSAGAGGASAAVSLGRSLAEARKARGLSIAEVAQAIKFSPRQIEAIESDDFGKLPGATIVRGFIRSYAKLLRLDPTVLLTMFDRQVPPVAATMAVLTDTGAALPQVGERSGPLLNPLLMLSIVAAVAGGAAAYYYWPTGTLFPGAPAATTAAPSAPAATLPAVEQAAPIVAPEAPGAVTSAAPDAAQAAQQAADAGSQPIQPTQPFDPDLHQLIFVFDDKAWVEVKDASQRVIFAQNNLPGTRQVVAGKPPFAVVIGNASHVQLIYEERQIDLQPYTKVDVARFNLE